MAQQNDDATKPQLTEEQKVIVNQAMQTLSSDPTFLQAMARLTSGATNKSTTSSGHSSVKVNSEADNKPTTSRFNPELLMNLKFTPKNRKRARASDIFSPAPTPKAIKKERTFYIDIVLLKNRELVNTPVTGNPTDRKFLLQGAKLDQNWSESELKQKIREKFAGTLSPSNDFSFLYMEIKSKKLEEFCLPPDQEVDGEYLHRMTKKQKKVYLCPEIDIISNEESGESEETDESHQTTQCDSVRSVITLCQNVVIEASILRRLEIDRKEPILPVLFQLFMDPDFTLKATPLIRFKNEAGVGRGLLKEFFTLVLREMRDGPLLEGTVFSKTVTKNRPALEAGTFERYGEVCAWSIIHGGPFPSFFSRVFCNLLANGNDIDLGVNDAPNETVKNDLEKVLKAQDIHSINSAMVDSTLFANAGTYQQVGGSEFLYQRDKAVRDALKDYCIDRIADEVASFKKGLNRDFDLLEKLCTVDLGGVFCHSGKILNAPAVWNIFQNVDPEVSESEVCQYFRIYLKRAEDKAVRHSLERILKQITGMYDIPHLGYPEHPPKIQLQEICFPKVQQCFNLLYLPGLLDNYDEFELAMNIMLDDDAYDEA